jgi:hypothetical protein
MTDKDKAEVVASIERIARVIGNDRRMPGELRADLQAFNAWAQELVEQLTSRQQEKAA